jgi:hypothetical protein
MHLTTLWPLSKHQVLFYGAENNDFHPKLKTIGFDNGRWMPFVLFRHWVRIKLKRHYDCFKAVYRKCDRAQSGAPYTNWNKSPEDLSSRLVAYPHVAPLGERHKHSYFILFKLSLTMKIP